MKETISQIHAIAGYLVFATGVIQLLAKKGGIFHRLIGYIYFLGWIVILGSGAYLGRLMITFLGVFGFYYALSGLRYAMVKRIPDQIFDKVQASVGFLTGLSILVSGFLLLRAGNTGFATIMFVFGSLFSYFGFRDVQLAVLNKRFHRFQSHGMYWYIQHYNRMIISFIAAMTAFSAIQSLSSQVVVNWLWPTLAGTVIIIILNRKNEREFGMR